MSKTFQLQTKFGLLYYIVNGSNELYVSNRGLEGYNAVSSEIIIRNKNHYNLHLRFGLMPNGELGGRTYDFDGNTLCFVEDKNNSYFKIRAVYMSQQFGVNDATNAAKTALYDEVKAKLNEFFKSHKEEIQAEFSERIKEDKAEKIKSLQTKIGELSIELTKLNNELAQLNS